MVGGVCGLGESLAHLLSSLQVCMLSTLCKIHFESDSVLLWNINCKMLNQSFMNNHMTEVGRLFFGTEL